MAVRSHYLKLFVKCSKHASPLALVIQLNVILYISKHWKRLFADLDRVSELDQVSAVM